MDFNTNRLSTKKIVIISLALILIFLIIGICIYLNNRTIVEEPIIEDTPPTIIVDSDPLIIEPDAVEQSKTVGKLIAYVKNIRDLSTRIEYDIEVGLGENTTSSIVKATGNTAFFDFSTKSVAFSSDVKVGSSLVIYSTGNYNVGDLSAKAICLGTETSYNYGEIVSINSQSDGSYIWTIEGMDDKLLVDSNCILYDAYTKGTAINMGEIEKKDKLLYKGDLVTTDIGNVYRCDEIIILGKWE